MTDWSFIPQIYVTTIDKGSSHMKKLKVAIKRLGIDADTVYFNVPPPLHKQNKIDSCADNHLTCIRDAYKKDLDFALILEDDVYVKDQNDLEMGLKAVESFIKTNADWDIIYLGHSPFYMKPRAKKHSVIPSISWITHAYIISRRYIKVLSNTKLETLQKNTKLTIGWPVSPIIGRGYNHIDVIMLNHANTGTIKSYAVYPRMIDQSSQTPVWSILMKLMEDSSWQFGNWLVTFYTVSSLFVLFCVFYYLNSWYSPRNN